MSTYTTPDQFGTAKRRVSYFYDTEVGNYHYGMGHPMKVRLCIFADIDILLYKLYLYCKNILKYIILTMFET